jgi:hypothetical protein
MVTRLIPGQRATVLQLPASADTRETIHKHDGTQQRSVEALKS